ncbi:MAG: hypothetical protein P1V97_17380 [Planctomycetota bacterium]|nr:hypothetical protein [Planctomycetota bacterium]
MAKCDLSIEFDGNIREYAIGDIVRGRVTVQANSNCTCNGLILTGLWRAHGHGNRASEDCHEEILFRGDWTAGQKETFPFHFEVPPGPLSFHGHYLNVDWFVGVTADIPWALDPSAEEDFIVFQEKDDDTIIALGEFGLVPELDKHLGLSASSVDTFKTHRIEVVSNSQSLSGMGPLIAGIVLAVGLLFSCIFGSVLISDFGPFALLFAVLPLAMTSMVAFFLVRNFLAEKKLGKVEVKLQPSALFAPGRRGDLEVKFCPTAAASLNKVTASLKGQERVIRGSGSNRTTHTHVIFEEDFTLCEARALSVGEPVTLQANFKLPDNAPISFKASDNFLEWTIAIHIDIPSWPDWNESHTFVVYPAAIVDGLFGDFEDYSQDNIKDIMGSSKPAESAQASTASPDALAMAPIVAVSSPEVETSASSDASLASVLEELKNASFTSDREKIYGQHESTSFSFDLKVERVSETSGMDALAGRSGGQTVVGQPVGLEGVTVAVQFDASLNEETKSLQEGDELAVAALIQGWNALERQALLSAQI